MGAGELEMMVRMERRCRDDASIERPIKTKADLQ
jgi:hypothetical protein